MRSTMSKTSSPSCSRTVSPSMRPSRRMSARSGASFSASAASRFSLRSLRANDIGGRAGGRGPGAAGPRAGLICAAHQSRRKRLRSAGQGLAGLGPARGAALGPASERRMLAPPTDPPVANASVGAEARAQGGRVLQLAFVDYQRPPAHRRPAPRRRRRVARAVARDLGAPIVGVGLGHARAARAVVAMPEAAVDEDRQLAGGRRRCRACPAGRRDRAGSRARARAASPSPRAPARCRAISPPA